MSPMLYQSQQQQDSSYRVADSIAMEAERLNLIRQRSSPAGLFSHLNVQKGYGGGTTRGMNGFEPAGIPAANRLKAQISFSEIGGVSNSSNSPEESSLISLFDNPLISDGFSGQARSREIDGKLVHGLNQSEHQNGQLMSCVSGLSSSDMTTIEKFLQCQDSVPCKIRAKRGFATHPRSIAERVRRTRISERMRKLQELVPNMDKQTNTANMLDLAVEYINNLQQEVKGLSDSQASCTCSSSKKKPYSRPTA